MYTVTEELTCCAYLIEAFAFTELPLERAEIVAVLCPVPLLVFDLPLALFTCFIHDNVLDEVVIDVHRVVSAVLLIKA